MRLYDAHNHLQDERLAPHYAAICDALHREGVCGMVVNGSSEFDWQQVLEVSKKHQGVVPSFGYHPWYVQERSGCWRERLVSFLDSVPSCIGEIGLDRWIKGHDMARQEEVFLYQWRLAAERELPASIHCLQAWGRLLDLLVSEPRSKTGFVLHSFGGPKEMIKPLADLGAYFSLPGYFAHERKARQREAFSLVPLERLLIETDAPDQLLPPERNRYPLEDSMGKPANHPANLTAVYDFAAELRQMPVQSLADQVEANFLRLFGRFLRSTSVHTPSGASV